MHDAAIASTKKAYASWSPRITFRMRWDSDTRSGLVSTAGASVFGAAPDSLSSLLCIAELIEMRIKVDIPRRVADQWRATGCPEVSLKLPTPGVQAVQRRSIVPVPSNEDNDSVGLVLEDTRFDHFRDEIMVNALFTAALTIENFWLNALSRKYLPERINFRWTGTYEIDACEFSTFRNPFKKAAKVNSESRCRCRISWTPAFCSALAFDKDVRVVDEDVNPSRFRWLLALNAGARDLL